MNYCRCDGTPLGDADHCTLCGCEEFEERRDCPCATNQPSGLSHETMLTVSARHANAIGEAPAFLMSEGEYRLLLEESDKS